MAVRINSENNKFYLNSDFSQSKFFVDADFPINPIPEPIYLPFAISGIEYYGSTSDGLHDAYGSENVYCKGFIKIGGSGDTGECGQSSLKLDFQGAEYTSPHLEELVLIYKVQTPDADDINGGFDDANPTGITDGWNGTYYLEHDPVKPNVFYSGNFRVAPFRISSYEGSGTTLVVTSVYSSGDVFYDQYGIEEIQLGHINFPRILFKDQDSFTNYSTNISNDFIPWRFGLITNSQNYLFNFGAMTSSGNHPEVRLPGLVRVNDNTQFVFPTSGANTGFFNDKQKYGMRNVSLEREFTFIIEGTSYKTDSSAQLELMYYLETLITDRANNDYSKNLYFYLAPSAGFEIDAIDNDCVSINEKYFNPQIFRRQDIIDNDPDSFNRRSWSITTKPLEYSCYIHQFLFQSVNRYGPGPYLAMENRNIAYLSKYRTGYEVIGRNAAVFEKSSTGYNNAIRYTSNCPSTSNPYYEASTTYVFTIEYTSGVIYRRNNSSNVFTNWTEKGKIPIGSFTPTYWHYLEVDESWRISGPTGEPRCKTKAAYCNQARTVEPWIWPSVY